MYTSLKKRKKQYLIKNPFDISIMNIFLFFGTVIFNQMCRAYCHQTQPNITKDSSRLKLETGFLLPELNIEQRKEDQESLLESLENPVFNQNHQGKTDEMPNDNEEESIQLHKYDKKEPKVLWNTRQNQKKRKAKRLMDTDSEKKLLNLIMNGLGLSDLPDIKKINISQTEYVNKYKEYLQRINKRRKRENEEANLKNTNFNNFSSELKIISLRSCNISQNSLYENLPNGGRTKREYQKDVNKNGKEQKINSKTSTLLQFSMNSLGKETQLINTGNVEEANLRLLIIYNSPAVLMKKHRANKMGGQLCNISNTTAEKKTFSRKQQNLNVKIFQRLQEGGKRVFLDRKKIDINHLNEKNFDTNTQSRWLQFDVSQAVKEWLKRGVQSNLDLELLCDKCARIGARIISEISTSSDADHDRLVPVINILTNLGHTATLKNDDFSSSSDKSLNGISKEINSTNIAGSCQQNKNSNNNKHPRCCRHSMQVVFSKIRGFEFIIQPKTFDAGYCFGRCPIRFNPAHHHAMLQGLIWKQSNGLEAPRPCCSPSKLVDLEVLHVDEKSSEKLKISTWTDMRVVECACS